MPTTDLGDLDPGRREDEVRRLVAEEARIPFDLARGPMLRARLIRLDDREHVVYVVMHHIASDGWSIGVLIREVGALYEAFRRGEASPLAEPSLQDADFAAWQRRWLKGRVLEDKVEYWKEKLAGVATLELPTGRRRPGVTGEAGALRTIELTRELLEGLRGLSRQGGATLYMTLLAGFQVLLHR